jgi:hypothetical protein
MMHLTKSTSKTFTMDLPLKGILKRRTMEESLQVRFVPRLSTRKKCFFDLVEVREHEIILDKPLSSDDIMAALTVAWNPVSKQISTVHDFELERSDGRRGKNVRSLPTEERISLLIRAGFQLEDICLARVPDSPNKSKTRNATPGSKCRKPPTTVLSRMRFAAKNLVKQKDSARKALFSAAA